MKEKIICALGILMCACIVICLNTEIKEVPVEAKEEIWYVDPTTTPSALVPQKAPLKPDDLSVVSKVDRFKPVKQCPWTKKQQKKIKAICDKYSISFELCIAQAKVESNWNTKCVYDNGNSKGAWQIQYKHWSKLIKKLGYTENDLFDLYKSCEIYCAIMLSHFEEDEDVYHALMTYNGGKAYADRLYYDKGIVSKYAKKVCKYADKYTNR